MGNKNSASKNRSSSVAKNTSTPYTSNTNNNTYNPSSSTPNYGNSSYSGNASNAGSTPTPTDTNTNRKELESLFEKCKKAQSSQDDEDCMNGEGIMAFCQDLDVDPTGEELLLIFWKLNLAEQLKITRKEFVDGFANLRAFNVKQIKEALPGFKSEVENDSKKFKQYYSHCFKMNREPGQKSMSVELALLTWNLVLKNKYKFMEDWNAFIQTEYKKAIPKDLWDNLYDFMNMYGNDVSKFDPQGAWPVAIDEFVEYLKKLKKM